MNGLKKFPISFADSGDPFVDAGGLALKSWTQFEPKKSLMELIEQVTRIYVERWDGKINSLFLNSKITQPSYKGKARIDATLLLYHNMLEPSDEQLKGFCRTCGQEGYIFLIGRDQFCLAGSAAFINFHHFHQTGISICVSCAVKLFFLPLITLQMGGNLALLHATHELTKKYWLTITVKANYRQLGLNKSAGLLKNKITNPENALLCLASEAAINADTEYKDEMQLFHFSNFGASPDCMIYHLPSPVFIFLNKVLRYHRREWYEFVRYHYIISKAEWNDSLHQWRKNDQELDEEEYHNNRNRVIKKLLGKESILPLFRKYFRKKVLSSQHIERLLAVYYLMEVKGMQQEQIDLIKEIADQILALGQKHGTIKKYLVMIEGAGKAHQLRYTLLKIIKDRFRDGENKPLFTLDDYVNYLFPDGHYWGETRDMLLICLYEKLSSTNVNVEIESDQMIAETEERIDEI
jgi:CRISPR-associated protein Cst1